MKWRSREIVFSLAALAFFGLVWPTPYIYSQDKGTVYRTNRFTGRQDFATAYGWENPNEPVPLPKSRDSDVIAAVNNLGLLVTSTEPQYLNFDNQTGYRVSVAGFSVRYLAVGPSGRTRVLSETEYFPSGGEILGGRSTLELGAPNRNIATPTLLEIPKDSALVQEVSLRILSVTRPDGQEIDTAGAKPLILRRGVSPGV